MGSDATVIGPRLQLATSSGLYDLQGVLCRFAANGVNVCIATLAVGRREDASSSVVLRFERGDEARIFVEDATGFSTGSQTIGQTVAFTRESFVLFDGIIDDFGPGNLEFGIFSVQVRLFGKLAYLSSGTLGMSNISPATHLDTAVYFAWGSGTNDNPAQLDLRSVRFDFWDAIRDTLQHIAIPQAMPPPNSVVKTVKDYFGGGGGPNTRAFNVLDDISGSLVFNAQMDPFAVGIAANLNMLLMGNWQFAPFLQRICEMGEMLRFKIRETGSGIWIVPYTPFFRQQDALIITSRTYDRFRWDTQSEYRNYSGCVIVEGAHHDILNADTSEVLGVFRLSNNDGLGQVHVGAIPAWLSQVNENMFTGGGEQARSFSALINQQIGDRLAKYTTWELNYKNRRFTVSCPFFRTDIGPLEAVRVDFPPIPEVTGATQDLAVYGSVETVDVMIDATAMEARTTYTVGYARSYRQQERQIQVDLAYREHPFFTNNCVGGRLDTDEIRTSSAG